MKRKDKQKVEEPKVHPITMKELAEEQQIIAKCQKPIKLGWILYGIAAIIYILPIRYRG